MDQPLQSPIQNAPTPGKQLRQLSRYRLPLLASVAVLALAVAQDSRAHSKGRPEDLNGRSLLRTQTGKATHLSASPAEEREKATTDRMGNATASPASPVGHDPLAEIHHPWENRLGKWDLQGTLASAAESPSGQVTSDLSSAAPVKSADVQPATTSDDHPPAMQALVDLPPRTELRNPPGTGGEIRFLVDGTIYTLGAGSTLEFPGEQPRLVQFHRGDDFGNAERTLHPGVFEFHVTEQGWELRRAEEGANLPGSP